MSLRSPARPRKATSSRIGLGYPQSHPQSNQHSPTSVPKFSSSPVTSGKKKSQNIHRLPNNSNSNSSSKTRRTSPVRRGSGSGSGSGIPSFHSTGRSPRSSGIPTTTTTTTPTNTNTLKEPDLSIATGSISNDSDLEYGDEDELEEEGYVTVNVQVDESVYIENRHTSSASFTDQNIPPPPPLGQGAGLSSPPLLYNTSKSGGVGGIDRTGSNGSHSRSGSGSGSGSGKSGIPRISTKKGSVSGISSIPSIQNTNSNSSSNTSSSNNNNSNNNNQNTSTSNSTTNKTPFQYSYSSNRNQIIPTPTMDNTFSSRRETTQTPAISNTSNSNSNFNKSTIDGDFSTPTHTPTRNSTTSTTPDMNTNMNTPPKERKTRIQVCVRVRPILEKDAPHFQGTVGNSGSGSGGSGSGSNAMRSGSNRSLFSKPESRHRSNSPSTRNGRRVGLKKKSQLPPPPSSSSHSPSPSKSSVVNMEPAWTVHPQQNQIVQSASTHPDPTRTQSYTFDHVFGPKDSTMELYGKVIQDSIFATMEGFHASVFAYGQTATGKTHTMTGPRSNPRARTHTPPTENSLGIVQLAIQDCFNYIYSPNGESREYLLRVSFMEIYNEVIYDLLATPSGSAPTSHQMSVKGSGFHTPPPTTSIRIFESKNEGVVIRGLKEEIVTSPEQVFALLALGEKRRQTGSTNLNKESSRSHSVFRITIESRHRVSNASRVSSPVTSPLQRNTSDASSVGSLSSSVFAPSSSAGPVRVSTLSLVDLAGSESVRNTGSTGMRKKEGQYINKSLLTLGHVIRKLSDMSMNSEGGIDSTHIPYRDSKLTRILQQSLGGNAQISIICNVSPIPKHIEESHNTLKFATRAKRIKQTARVTEVMDDKTLLNNYREEIDELKRQLREAKEVEETLRQSQKASANAPLAISTSPSLTDDVGDDEETQFIVTAINNLERLILKTTTAEEKKRKKKRKEEESMKRRGPPKMVSLGEDAGEDSDSNDSLRRSNLSGNNLLDEDRQEDFGAEDSLDKKFQALNNRFNKINNNIADDQTLTSIGDESTIVEGKKLITELHRIQGLLGNVVARKGVATPTPVTGNRKQFFEGGSPDRDEEVERLRAQLEEQAREKSLRQADSTFLQQQLQEKDALLNEVSKILEAVEQRQVQLEEENATLKQEFTKIVAQARQEELNHEKTMAILATKEDEIEKLQKQLLSKY